MFSGFCNLAKTFQAEVGMATDTAPFRESGDTRFLNVREFKAKTHWQTGGFNFCCHEMLWKIHGIRIEI